MPSEVLRDLKKVWVCDRTLNISRMDQAGVEAKGGSKGAAKRPKSRKPNSGKPSPRKKGDSRKSPRKQSRGTTSSKKTRGPKA
jgi:hypothetical protein